MGISRASMPNPINQNLMMNMNNGMKPNMNIPNFMQYIENNVNENNIRNINCHFNFNGKSTYIVCSPIETVEEMLKKYLKRNNLEFMIFENEDLQFIFDGKRITKFDLSTQLKTFIRPLRDFIEIIICKIKDVV